MHRIAPIARVLLGLVFVVFSLNHFVPFLPPQPAPPAEALAFIGPFVGAGFLGLVKVLELAAGLALLANRLVPLALVVLAPIVIGITWFHATLAPGGLGLSAGLIVLELVLAWAYRSAFAPLLQLRTTPARAAAPARTLAAVA